MGLLFIFLRVGIDDLEYIYRFINFLILSIGACRSYTALSIIDYFSSSPSSSLFLLLSTVSTVACTCAA